MINTFMILSVVTPDCRDEYDYLYVWKGSYLCVDATYLNIKHSRESSISSLRLHIYKLWYMNPDISSYALADMLVLMLRSIVVIKSVYITENDIYDEVDRIMKDKLPYNISDIVISKKRIEWKSNIRGLYELREGELESFSVYKGYELHKRLRDRITLLKRNYALECLRETNMEVKIDRITVEMNKSVDTILISDLSSMCGISVRSIKSVIGMLPEDLRCRIVNGNVATMERNSITVKNEVDRIMKEGEVISINKIHKRLGISRRTVKKYVDSLNL